MAPVQFRRSLLRSARKRAGLTQADPASTDLIARQGTVYLYGVRYDDTTVGFTAQDQLTRLLDPNNGNRYTYAADNPANRINPTGRVSAGDLFVYVDGALIGLAAPIPFEGYSALGVGAAYVGLGAGLLYGGNTYLAEGFDLPEREPGCRHAKLQEFGADRLLVMSPQHWWHPFIGAGFGGVCYGVVLMVGVPLSGGGSVPFAELVGGVAVFLGLVLIVVGRRFVAHSTGVADGSGQRDDLQRRSDTGSAP